MQKKLEIACFNLDSCLIAQSVDAHRIELCENYSVGGTTPEQSIIIEARKKINIDLFVMIRPREGNFIYSNEEFEKMKSQILFCKEQKCDGVVFGVLTRESKIDVNRCKELIKLAGTMQCTFHRAFDEVENDLEALESCIEIGFKRILTSGKAKTALEGINRISSLIRKANNRITILPGGGIRSSNIAEVIKRSAAIEFHSAAITNNGEITDKNEIEAILSNF